MSRQTLLTRQTLAMERAEESDTAVRGPNPFGPLDSAMQGPSPFGPLGQAYHESAEQPIGGFNWSPRGAWIFGGEHIQGPVDAAQIDAQVAERIQLENSVAAAKVSWDDARAYNQRSYPGEVYVTRLRAFFGLNESGGWGNDVLFELAKFQSKWKLSIDAKNGPQTKKALREASFQGEMGEAQAVDKGPNANIDPSLPADIRDYYTKNPMPSGFVRDLQSFFGVNGVPGVLDLVTLNAIKDFQRSQRLGDDGKLGTLSNTALVKAGFSSANWGYFMTRLAPASRTWRSSTGQHHFTDTQVRLISSVAEEYYARTQQVLIVTSAYRGPLAQAQAMYNNMVTKSGWLMSTYKNKELAREVQQAYNSTSGRANRIAAMAAAMERQVARQQYISSHLNGAAFDLRKSDKTSRQQQILHQVVKQDPHGLEMIDEGNASQPHFHVQYKK